ncbi:MAG: phosphotransferase [Elusimicrobia bacterium]|nr:phosphotransferase [Elusimicrobiota bacterium]
MIEESLKELFHKCFSETVESFDPLTSDGSNRRYFRLKSAARSVVGVFGPDKKENAAFVGFSRHFRGQGLPAPEIYAEDQDQGIYIEEDLGDASLFKLLSEQRGAGGFPDSVIDVYEQAVRLLPQFQISAGKTLDWGLCYPRSGFDRQSMKWDLNHFKYYFLQLADIGFHEQALEDDFERFADFLLQAPRDFFLYRDFQSRNIMVKDGAPYFIDYQGGRKGALQYDIASLLFDAKADMPFDVRERLLDLYLKEADKLTSLNRRQFMEHYYGYVFIRIMQAMGAYGLRGFYERKSHFLQSIPYAVQNLEYLLGTVEMPVKLPELMGVFRRITGSSYLRQFGKAQLKLTVRIQSFSYRGGMPVDERGHGGGFVFDCRCLPNPGKHEQYAKLTGKDSQVITFLEKENQVSCFLNHVYGLVDQAVENYQNRNFTDLLVAFGCTGGLHRSVYCADRLAGHLKGKYNIHIEALHRALEKVSVGSPV